MCVIGLLFTVGMLTLVGVKIYMENKLSYFTFHWPILSTVGVMFSLVLINVMVTFLYVRRPEREKPKWEDTITNRMMHWAYTPE